MTKTASVVTLIVGFSALSAATVMTTLAQSSAEVVGSTGNVSPIVLSLDRSLQFYEGLLGLKSDPPSTASPTDVPRPPILQLEGTPEGRMKWSHLKFPGTQWWTEPLEFGDVDRAPRQPRLQDPGAVTVVLHVRDIDGLVARMKTAGTPIVTPGGSPVPVNPGRDKSRAIIVKDPDGHFVELLQPDPISASAPSSDVIDGHVRLTIGDTDETMHLYRDLLGFQPTIGSFAPNDALSALTGLRDARYRLTSSAIPGEPRLTLEFMEVKGVDRTPLNTRIYDPGATRLMLLVRSIDSAVGKFKAAGGTVVSTGGRAVTLGPGGPYIVVRDLNNFFIILREQAK